MTCETSILAMPAGRSGSALARDTPCWPRFRSCARIDLSLLPAWALVAGGVLWTGAFVAAFALLLRRNGRSATPRRLAAAGLGASLVFLCLDALLPLRDTVSACCVPGGPVARLGEAGAMALYFALGALYALVPLGLFSVAALRRVPTPAQPIPRSSALIVAGLFCFLVAPAIFLQCKLFFAGALLPWLGGTLLGAFGGAAAGAWLVRRAVPRNGSAHPT